MRKRSLGRGGPLALALMAVIACPAAQAATSGPDIEISRRAAQPPRAGPAANFSGVVEVDAPFQGRGDARVSGATVSFARAARTAWHTHPLGQTLVVTQGCGLVQREGGAVSAIHPGDVVWIPAGTRHWHGASPTTSMTHVAIVETFNGKSVEWMEHVSDELYGAGARTAPCTSPKG